MVTLYNVVSADGYIARKNGSEDFIPDSYWPFTLQFLEKHDVILLGRKSYETIQSYDQEMRDSFDALPTRKVVVSHDKSFQVKPGYELATSPEEVLKPDLDTAVTSGPTVNDYLIGKGLVDKIVQHEIPAKIGEGIRPYRSTGSVKSIRIYDPA